MMPDLPMPVRMTRPRQQRSSSTARSNVASSRGTSARIAPASVSSTLLASARSAMGLHDPWSGAGVLCLGPLRDRIDGQQTTEKGFDAIEAQGVLRVAFGARGVFV